MLQLTSSQCRC